MNPKAIINELRRINDWRRGDETVGQPAPGHFGDVLDAAAESLASLIASNTTLRSEARAELKQRKADVTRMEEYLRNSGRNMDEAQEQIAERDARVADLSDALARVTAERDDALYREQMLRSSERNLLEIEAFKDAQLVAAQKELSALRARVAEQRKYIDSCNDLTAERDGLQRRNAELVAALDDLLKCPTVTDRATCPNGDPSRIDEAPEWQAVLQISCAWTRYKKLKVLASAESATPDHIPDAAKMVSATPAKHPDVEMSPNKTDQQRRAPRTNP